MTNDILGTEICRSFKNNNNFRILKINRFWSNGFEHDRNSISAKFYFYILALEITQVIDLVVVISEKCRATNNFHDVDLCHSFTSLALFTLVNE